MASIEEMQAENDRLRKALAAAAPGTVEIPVEGTFTVEGETPDGKKSKRTFRFKNGRIRTPIPGGQQVPTTALMALAAGKAHKEIEGTANFPWFANLTQADAQAVLNNLVTINSAEIEETK
jgi:hypothetical protein